MLRKTITDLAINTLASNPVCAAMESMRSHCIPVFMLHRMEDKPHGVHGHKADLLEAALEYVKENQYNAISIEDMVKRLSSGERFPKRAIAFTMDDGFYDQAEIALPLFEKYQIPVTLFLATDMIDHCDWSWDYQLEFAVYNTLMQNIDIIIAGKPYSSVIDNDQSKRIFLRSVRNHLKSKTIEQTQQELKHIANTLKVDIPTDAPNSYRAIPWSDLRALESDIIRFGAHTKSHTVLSLLDGQVAYEEIEGSWHRLQMELKYPCPVFCYPNGRPVLDFGEREKNIVKNVGLLGALSAEPGYVDELKEKNDLFSLRRFSFPDNLTQFKQYCTWIERAKSMLLNRQ